MAANIPKQSKPEALYVTGGIESWGEHHRAIEKNEYIPTDGESIRGARSENRRNKNGVFGLTKPIIL